VHFGNQHNEGTIYGLQVQGAMKEVKVESVEIFFYNIPKPLDEMPIKMIWA
jgi:hypothetical protein